MGESASEREEMNFPRRRRVFEGHGDDSIVVYVDRLTMWGFLNYKQLETFMNACLRSQARSENCILSTNTALLVECHRHPDTLTQVKLGAVRQNIVNRGTKPFHGAHYGEGSDPLDDSGRVILCSTNGIVVTLPFRFQPHIAKAARACGVSAQQQPKATSPFPVAGQYITTSVKNLIKILEYLEKHHGMTRFDPAFSAYGEWDELALVPTGSPGAVEHPLLKRYGKAWSAAAAENAVLQAVLDAASSPPCPTTNKYVVGSVDIRLHVKYAHGPGCHDMPVFKCNGEFGQTVLGNMIMPQMFATVCKHVADGGDPSRATSVALGVCDHPAGAVKMSLQSGGQGKGGKGTSPHDPPTDVVEFTQVIVYLHDTKQDVHQTGDVQTAIDLRNPAKRVSASENQAREITEAVQRLISPPDTDRLGEDAGDTTSEDMELSANFGGPALSGRKVTLKDFVVRFLNKAESIARSNRVEVVGVIPEAVWKGFGELLCDHVLGHGATGAHFRRVDSRMSQEQLHALSTILCATGQSFKEMGYWRDIAQPLVHTSQAQCGQLRVLADLPPKGKRSKKRRCPTMEELFAPPAVRQTI